MVFAIWECDIQGVEADEEVLGSPELLESGQNTRLHPCIPHELLVCNTVGTEGVDLGLVWKVLLNPGVWIVEVKSFVIEGLEPFICLLLVCYGSVSWNGTFDDCITILEEICSPAGVLDFGTVAVC